MEDSGDAARPTRSPPEAGRPLAPTKSYPQANIVGLVPLTGKTVSQLAMQQTRLRASFGYLIYLWAINYPFFTL